MLALCRVIKGRPPVFRNGSVPSRRASVDRLWRRARVGAFNRSWRKQSLATAIWLPNTFLVLLATAVEVRWWEVRLGGPLGALGAAVPIGRFGWVLAGIGGANMLAAHWSLRQGCPGRRTGWLPLLLAGLPGFGCLWAVTVGRWLATRRVQERRAAGRSSAGGWRRIWYFLDKGPRGAALLLPWWTMASLLGCLVLILVLASRPGRGPALSQGLAVMSLHLLGFALARLAAREPDEHLPGRWRLALDLLWLLPLAGQLVAWAGSQVLAHSGARERSLSHAAFLHRTSLAGSPRWSLTEGLLLGSQTRPGWRQRWRQGQLRRRRAEPSREALRFLQVARGKIGSLLLDGLALGWFLGFALGATGRGLEEGLPALLGGAAGTTLVAASAAGAAAGARLAASLRGQGSASMAGPAPLVWWLYSALNPGLGLVAGGCLGLGQFPAFAQLLAYGFALGLTLSLLPWMLASIFPSTFDARGGDPRHWTAFYGLLLLTALPSLLAVGFLVSLAPAVPWLPIAAALVSWRYTFRGTGNLIEPFDRTDLSRGDLPWRARLALGFLRCTLLLPFGGLFVTLWPVLRRWLEATEGAERRRRRGLAAETEA